MDGLPRHLEHGCGTCRRKRARRTFSSASVEFKDGKAHIRTCFVAGTLIHTKDGTKNIEDVQIGDVVLSWNEKTGEREYKRVTNVWQRTTNELYKLKLPAQEPITTTWNHPFWSVTQSAWIETKDLKEGEILSLENGSEVAIESILNYNTEETTVYNFEVEDNHTYYVSEAGVLVHNQSTFYLPPVTGAGMSLDPNTGFGSLVSGASDFIRENPTLDTILDKFGIATPIHAFGDAHKDLVKFETLSALKNVAIGVASIPMFRKGSGAGKTPVLRVDKPKNGKGNQRIVNPNKQDSPIWKSISDKTKNSDIRQSGKVKDKRYFQWDHTHNDIEVYDRNKKHLGSMNPVTGEIYKPPVTGRKLDIK
ncbi:MAG: polymorphic toxin-type HINT domain-containing protein [Leptospiraceae bacterium]|nr:polymorphic toxin-type HINT domain-containing protein [Leptospiraceae bacterium]MCZ8344845.1 polymorphic toxin-type HINT domain-containing protein [Leptospiraceae bacterium]